MNWGSGDWHIELARALERACFDYMMFEDSLMVGDTYGGKMDINLKYGNHGPKLDPMTIIPVISKFTKHIGLIATGSTSFYPPFMLARTMASLSHISGARTGWNIVTSSEDRAAQNFGMEGLPLHDDRYDRADEYCDVVEALWGSWEPDAVIMDRETNTYVDASKVHTIDFEGKYFRSRGPLPTLPIKGGRPVYCQAGSSTRGRKFAADHADTVLASMSGVTEMKKYRDDVRAHMVDIGRDPDSLKMLFIISPIIADSVEEAQAIKARNKPPVEARLASLSALFEIDLSRYDLDAPIDQEMETNGHRGYMERFIATGGGGKTLREVAQSFTISSLDLMGTPESIAAEMDEVMQEVGGDGFLFGGISNRRQLAEITEGLVPELQRRGLTRTEYSHDDLRGNLFAF
jgi:FMN-dependent oxidoreductase (nitrilotriacetate monooxygenase family)